MKEQRKELTGCIDVRNGLEDDLRWKIKKEDEWEGGHSQREGDQNKKDGCIHRSLYIIFFFLENNSTSNPVIW